MKKKLVTVTALALSAIASPAVAETTDWSGPYVGAYAGMNANETDVTGNYLISNTGTADAPGISGNALAAGGTLGYNVQVDDSFVIGLEGDFGTGAKRSNSIETSICMGPGSCTQFTNTWKSNPNWLATVRARAGLASGNTLFYVTGGLAVSDTNVSYSPGANPIEEKKTSTGYAAGVGVEHRLGHGFSVKAEYLRMSFSHVVAYAPSSIGVDFKPTVNSLRLGVNYAF